MSVADWPPQAWLPGTYRHGRHVHSYYVVGAPAGSPVLLMHEFPGISESLVELADDLAEEFRVFVPSIVGRDGDPSTLGTVAELCVRREVNLLRLGHSSRAVPWLRSLLADVVGDGASRCGVVGMCMTGGFALALAVDPRVRAAVVAQPAVLPSQLGRLPLPQAQRRAADLGLTKDDCDRLAARVQADPESLRVQGYRFTRDTLSPPAKLAAASALLGPAMEVFELDAPDATAHSTLTGALRNRGAVTQVKGFLRQRLQS